jgi:hypothetical protein
MKLIEVNNNEIHEGGNASLIFRVRCETLGQGESIFLVRADDPINLVTVPTVSIKLVSTVQLYIHARLKDSCCSFGIRTVIHIHER